MHWLRVCVIIYDMSAARFVRPMFAARPYLARRRHSAFPVFDWLHLSHVLVVVVVVAGRSRAQNAFTKGARSRTDATVFIQVAVATVTDPLYPPQC